MVLINEKVNRCSCSSDDNRGDINNVKYMYQQRSECKEEQKQRQGKFNSSETDPLIENNLELLDLIMDAAKKLGQRIKHVYNFILIDLKCLEITERFVQWCSRHPQITILLLAALLVTSLPFLLFMGFAAATIVMTFTGFLVLEGTLLTISTMLLFGLLGALCIVSIFFAVAGAAIYFGASHVYSIYHSTDNEEAN